ncbi:MAG: hypothetical protein U9Q33_13055 [Campylobacterota bacterium]|nr:hypothetical protein [Campylobacterota bacterium]
MLEELLKKVDFIEELLKTLQELQLQNNSSLTPNKDVASFLGVTQRTYETTLKKLSLKRIHTFIKL